jgi:hypothetical protein
MNNVQEQLPRLRNQRRLPVGALSCLMSSMESSRWPDQ